MASKKTLQNMVTILARATHRPLEWSAATADGWTSYPRAIRLDDRGTAYPYRYSLVVCMDEIGTEEYYMGGTGQYYTYAGMVGYLDGCIDTARESR